MKLDKIELYPTMTFRHILFWRVFYNSLIFILTIIVGQIMRAKQFAEMDTSAPIMPLMYALSNVPYPIFLGLSLIPLWFAIKALRQMFLPRMIVTSDKILYYDWWLRVCMISLEKIRKWRLIQKNEEDENQYASLSDVLFGKDYFKKRLLEGLDKNGRIIFKIDLSGTRVDELRLILRRLNID